MTTIFVSSANPSVSIPNGPDIDPLLLDLKDAFVRLVENLIGICFLFDGWNTVRIV